MCMTIGDPFSKWHTKNIHEQPLRFMSASLFALKVFCSIGSTTKGRMKLSQEQNIGTKNLRHENRPGNADNTAVASPGHADMQAGYSVRADMEWKIEYNDGALWTPRSSGM